MRMAGNHTERLLFRRKRSDTVPVSVIRTPSQLRPPVPDSKALRRQEGDRDDKGRRQSLSDPTKRRNSSMSPTGVGGLLGKLGSLLSLTPTTPRVYYSGKSYSLLPKKKLVPFHPEITASYSGPYGGLTNGGLVPPAAEKNPVLSPGNGTVMNGSEHGVDGNEDEDTNGRNEKSPLSDADASKWRLRNERAYGMSVSLYEYKNSDRTECTGDPIADVFAIRTTCNSSIMAVADGVGWGQGARRAAQCAVKGSMEYLCGTLYSKDYKDEPFTTHDVFECMTKSLDEAQDLIISREGSLTTLCLAVVADVVSNGATCKALCVVSVGDSLAFVYSHQHGVREVTVGCREYNLHRNIRFCDGALGPCFGENPDLENLTFSFTTVEEGDIVFLTSDGVSDNFDPVVAKKAVANTDFKSSKSRAEIIFSDDQWEAGIREDARRMPAMTPRERQEEMTRTMEVTIQQTEIPSENPYSASNLCSKLLQHAVNLTENKRIAHEATNNIISICEKECVQMQTMVTGKEALSRHARSLPGKLDHATVVAYVVGGADVTDAPSSRPCQVISEDPTKEPFDYIDITVGNQQFKDLLSIVD